MRKLSEHSMPFLDRTTSAHCLSSCCFEWATFEMRQFANYSALTAAYD